MAKKIKQQWMVESIGIDTPSAFELTEAKDRPGKLIARGMFGLCDEKNGNGRIYPSRLMEAQIERLQPLIKNGQVTCQLDHPADGKPSLALAAAKLTNLYMEDNKIMGEAELLGTPSGLILKALWEGGVVTGVSSRGWGSTKQTESGEMVQEDFRLVTFDFVSDPSVKDALPKVYMEGMEEPGEHDADPVTMFQATFPESYTALVEAATVDAVERAKADANQAVEAAVVAERERVTGELKETFERNLRDALVGLREDLATEIRAEFAADPEIGGAKAALAQIIEMVSVYHKPADADAMADALKASDLEIQAAQAQVEDLQQQIAKTHRLMDLEKRIAQHPLAEELRQVLTPIVASNGVENLDEAIQAFVAKSDGMVPRDQVETLAAERMALTEERQHVKNLEKRVHELTRKVQEAQDIGEQLYAKIEEAEQGRHEAEASLDEMEAELKARAIEVYKLTQLLGIKNPQQTFERLSEAERHEVDAIVEAQRARAMVDDQLEATKREIRGIGLGSSKLRHIVEGHQGAPAPADQVERMGYDQLLNQ